MGSNPSAGTKKEFQISKCGFSDLCQLVTRRVIHAAERSTLHLFKSEIRNSQSEIPILLARVAQLEEAAGLRPVL